MADLLRNPNVPPPNLFTPDFGQEPHVVVGRDVLTQSLREGLGAGPGDRRFTTLLLGPRGSGKTVILNAMCDAARESGWIVLPLDASTDGIHGRISEYIEWAQQTHDALPDVTDTRREERSSTRFKIFLFEWQRELAREMRPSWGLRRQLTTLADHAAQHGSAVLLAIDELHSGDRTELRRMAADLQHVTKGEKLPLAFLGAGLSEMKHTLLEDKKMTFFQRCHRSDMPPLEPVDAARFLSKTVHDASGRFEGNALSTLAEASGALPFRMQLVGHCAWLISDAPFRPIGDQAADAAIREANRAMHEQVSVPTWHSLNTTEQQVMRALADLEGVATPHQIAERVRSDPATLSRAEQHLLNAGCVNINNDGSVEIADVITVDSMKLLAAQQSRYASDDPPNAAGTTRPASGRPRCNAHMPRAQARCVLPKGHAGGHRSR